MAEQLLANDQNTGQEQMVETQAVILPHTIAPPPGFKPLLATNQELIAAGLPRRPHADTQPKLHALWLKIISSDVKYVPCTLKPITQARKVLPPRIKRTGSDVENNLSNSIWSGAVIEPKFASNESFAVATASWTVPNAYPPASASTDDNTWKDGTYACSAWVGIDGYGGSDVFQTGTTSQVIVSGGKITTQDAYGWFEWFPTSPSSLYEGFQVSPGDTVHCAVCTGGVGATTGSAWIVNMTKGKYTHVIVPAPSKTSLVGNTAEFIMEDPSFGSAPNFTPAPFPDYGASFFYNCVAGTAVGGNLSNKEYTLADAFFLNIVQNGVTLSTAEVNGNVMMIYSGGSGPAN